MLRRSYKSIALVAVFCFGLLAPLQALAVPTKLEEGTKVRIKLLDSVSSGTNHEGDSVSFRVIDDVMAADEKTILIKADTPAWGSVSGLQERGHIGEKGQVSLAIDGTKSVDGKRVPLRAAINRSGKGQLGTVIALSFVITPLFLFMRGKDATIPAGTQINAYVDRDLLVDAVPATITTQVVEQPSPTNTAVVSTSAPAEVAATQTSAASSISKTRQEGSDAAEALDKLYTSGLLTKKEYEVKKKALAKKSVALNN